MDVQDALELLRRKAGADPELRRELLASAGTAYPVRNFCEIAAREGCPMDEMDLVMSGEEEYAAMRRSTNGGGENSPMLAGEDDYHSMFMAELRRMTEGSAD